MQFPGISVVGSITLGAPKTTAIEKIPEDRKGNRVTAYAIGSNQNAVSAQCLVI